MNVIDIFAGVVLIWCVWSGWKNGILVQLSGIIGVILGAWAAYRFSHTVGEWLDMEEIPTEVLFALVLIGVLICVIVLCRLLTKVLQAGGLSLPLKVLGVAFALTKGLLILGLMLITTDAVLPWLSPKNKTSLSKTLSEANSYSILKGASNLIFPYIAKGSGIITKEFEEKRDQFQNSIEDIDIIDDLDGAVN